MSETSYTSEWEKGWSVCDICGTRVPDKNTVPIPGIGSMCKDRDWCIIQAKYGQTITGVESVGTPDSGSLEGEAGPKGRKLRGVRR